MFDIRLLNNLFIPFLTLFVSLTELKIFLHISYLNLFISLIKLKEHPLKEQMSSFKIDKIAYL